MLRVNVADERAEAGLVVDVLHDDDPRRRDADDVAPPVGAIVIAVADRRRRRRADARGHGVADHGRLIREQATQPSDRQNPRCAAGARTSRWRSTPTGRRNGGSDRSAQVSERRHTAHSSSGEHAGRRRRTDAGGYERSADGAREAGGGRRGTACAAGPRRRRGTRPGDGRSVERESMAVAVRIGLRRRGHRLLRRTIDVPEARRVRRRVEPLADTRQRRHANQDDDADQRRDPGGQPESIERRKLYQDRGLSTLPASPIRNQDRIGSNRGDRRDR